MNILKECFMGISMATNIYNVTGIVIGSICVFNIINSSVHYKLYSYRCLESKKTNLQNIISLKESRLAEDSR